MPHTDASRWGSTPGNWDSLKLHRRFSSSNRFGIPDLAPCNLMVDKSCSLVSYKQRDDSGLLLARSLCHMFLDDYQIEPIWNRPLLGLARVSRFSGSLTPDFSLFRDWPLAAQLWNTYRSRWLGAFWQSCGLQVVPTVNWSEGSSYAFCFEGLPSSSVVAVGVPDFRDNVSALLFETGFWEMVFRVRPSRILVYGRLPFACSDAVEFEPDWVKLRSLRKRS